MTSFDLLAHPIALARPERLRWSGWTGHIPFGMYLIDVIRPALLVELGTHTGVSYCAFCQAVSELELNTRCFAVDTWHGDAYTERYGEDVYSDLSQYHDPRYGAFSTLLRTAFDDAVDHFELRSIDLLHIDGCHSYGAVRHDYETWLPKMSPRGIVLFHDVAVDEEGFGVHRLWTELKPRYRHFELPHSFGLGVLAVGEESPALLKPLLDCTEEEQRHVVKLFGQLGRQLELEVDNSNLAAELKASRETIRLLESELRAFYKLAQHPLVRFVRGWKRYGGLGLMGLGLRRLMGLKAIGRPLTVNGENNPWKL